MGRQESYWAQWSILRPSQLPLELSWPCCLAICPGVPLVGPRGKGLSPGWALGLLSASFPAPCICDEVDGNSSPGTAAHPGSDTWGRGARK